MVSGDYEEARFIGVPLEGGEQGLRRGAGCCAEHNVVRVGQVGDCHRGAVCAFTRGSEAWGEDNASGFGDCTR